MVHRPGQENYNFVNMTGKALAGVHVLERYPGDTYGARWKVKHDACGHESIERGAKLRAAAKENKRSIRCWVCKPKHERIGA